MDWDKLRIFHAAAQAGSFTRAGEALNMSQSAVSRQVSALEQELGTPLFHRHARGLILTEEGDLLMRAARDIMLKLENVRAQLVDSRGQPTGTLARHDHRRARLDLAYLAHPRIRRPLSGHPPRAGARGQRARHRHAPGGRGDPPARADAARPDPAKALHGAFPRLRVARLHEALRPAAEHRRTSTHTASSCSARTRRDT